MGWFALYVVALVAACSLDDFVEYGGVIGIDDGASDGVFASEVVDGSREARLELKTRGAVTLPKGALADTVEIGIERPADEDAIKLVKSLKDYQAIVSVPYVLTPHGTKFRQPVTIEIPITKQTDKKLVVAWLENESDKTWKKLGEPTVKDGVAKIAVDHFSVVMLLEEDRANLAGDDAPEDKGGADAGSSSGPGANAGSMNGGSNGGPFPAGYDPNKPGTFDAGAGTSSGGNWGYDAGYVGYGPDAAPYPVPFPFPPADAGIYFPPADAGAYFPPPDASVYYPPADAGVYYYPPADAGSPKLSDAGYDAAKL